MLQRFLLLLGGYCVDVCVREPIMYPLLDVCVSEPIMDPLLDVCVREPIMDPLLDVGCKCFLRPIEYLSLRVQASQE